MLGETSYGKGGVFQEVGSPEQSPFEHGGHRNQGTNRWTVPASKSRTEGGDGKEVRVDVKEAMELGALEDEFFVLQTLAC